MKRWKKITGFILIVFAVGGGIWWSRRRGDEQEARTTTVQRGTIVRDVTFTGEVTAQQAADLALEFGGIVRRVHVAAGDTVAADATLIRLDDTTAQLEAAKATADLASAQDAARLALEKAQHDARNVTAENAHSVEQQKQLVRNAKTDFEQAEQVWQARVKESGEESSLAETAYATYLSAKGAYTTAQKTLETLLATVEKSNEAARAAVAAAEQDYRATTQVSGDVAGLSSLQALHELAAAKLRTLALSAPFAGTVTNVAVEVGEYAAPGQAVVTLQTVDALTVKANVTETDAAKIMAGMSADIAFDALPDADLQSAHVATVAPAAILIEGVPTYEITLQFDGTPPELRPGLTADVTVHTATRDNTLVVPRRAVVAKDGRDVVRAVRSEGQFEEVAVETGLIGSDGQIEIVWGVTEGQEIVVSAPDGGQ